MEPTVHLEDDESSERSPEAGYKQATILVADDDAGIRMLLGRFLEDAGYLVIQAADGQEALDLFRQNQASVDLIVTDVVMPKMNGFEFAAQVLSLESEALILFMSGDSGYTNRGAGCLAKPFRPSELIARVSEVLRDSPTGKGLRVANAF